jgi:alkanesulfonate monooxygenase SsuD/methylene tetrahydromethanopterin reductase-like flavin-dependent oxidoreductase (luciferase family)
MEFGASIFFTEYSISPAELAVALEERGFDSLWAAEHSHIAPCQGQYGAAALRPRH